MPSGIKIMDIFVFGKVSSLKANLKQNWIKSLHKCSACLRQQQNYLFLNAISPEVKRVPNVELILTGQLKPQRVDRTRVRILGLLHDVLCIMGHHVTVLVQGVRAGIRARRSSLPERTVAISGTNTTQL